MGRTIRERARIERVRILLQTRNDDYPAPRSLSIPSTPSGPAPGRKRKCPACDGRGRIRTSTVCPSCDGTGKIAVDSYTGRVSGQEDRKPAPMDADRVEAELARLSTSLKLSAGEIDPNESYGWEKQLERRNRQGSYKELERCLEALRAVSYPSFDFLMWIYGSGLTVAVAPANRLVEERIVAALASVMPSKIKLPHHLARELAERKERIVLGLRDKGADVEEMAEAALLSESTVRKIIGTTRQATFS